MRTPLPQLQALQTLINTSACIVQARSKAVVGMSLRQYYAGTTIKALISIYGSVEAIASEVVAEKLAKAAFNVADAMVREAKRQDESQ